LAREHPDRAEYLTDLTGNLTVLGHFNSRQNPVGAEKLLRRAVEVGERSVRLAPDNDEAACQLASACHALGSLLFDRGLKDQAADVVGRGRELVMPAGKPPPAGARDYPWVVPNLRLLTAQIAISAGRPQEAESEARQAISALERLERRHPMFFPNRVQLEPAYTVLGSACWAQGKDADAAWQKAVDHGRRMAKDFPTFPRPVGNRDQHLLDVLLTCVRAKRDVPRVVAAADALAAKKNFSALSQYNLACVYALAAAAMPGKAGDDYAARAMELLRRPAVVRWMRATPGMIQHARKTDRDLDALRVRSDFREWLAGFDHPSPPPAEGIPKEPAS
jgi:hypothetical protein